jgi:hypothetical protein
VLEKAMSDEEGAIEPGDVLEVRLRDFEGELTAATGGPALCIAELWNLRFGPARGVLARSYRVRIVGTTEADGGDRFLHVVEERRGTEDYGAIPMPGR